MAAQIFSNDNVNVTDETLTNMILAKLRNTNEPQKSKLRRKLINIIMEHIIN